MQKTNTMLANTLEIGHIDRANGWECVRRASGSHQATIRHHAIENFLIKKGL